MYKKRFYITVFIFFILATGMYFLTADRLGSQSSKSSEVLQAEEQLDHAISLRNKNNGEKKSETLVDRKVEVEEEKELASQAESKNENVIENKGIALGESTEDNDGAEKKNIAAEITKIAEAQNITDKGYQYARVGKFKLAYDEFAQAVNIYDELVVAGIVEKYNQNLFKSVESYSQEAQCLLDAFKSGAINETTNLDLQKSAYYKKTGDNYYNLYKEEGEV